MRWDSASVILGRDPDGDRVGVDAPGGRGPGRVGRGLDHGAVVPRPVGGRGDGGAGAAHRVDPHRRRTRRRPAGLGVVAGHTDRLAEQHQPGARAEGDLPALGGDAPEPGVAAAAQSPGAARAVRRDAGIRLRRGGGADVGPGAQVGEERNAVDGAAVGVSGRDEEVAGFVVRQPVDQRPGPDVGDAARIPGGLEPGDEDVARHETGARRADEIQASGPVRGHADRACHRHARRGEEPGAPRRREALDLDLGALAPRHGGVRAPDDADGLGRRHRGGVDQVGGAGPSGREIGGVPARRYARAAGRRQQRERVAVAGRRHPGERAAR